MSTSEKNIEGLLKPKFLAKGACPTKQVVEKAMELTKEEVTLHKGVRNTLMIDEEREILKKLKDAEKKGYVLNNEGSTPTIERIKPDFEWTDERVAEVSRLIYDNRRNSEVWSSDCTAELGIIKDFKISRMIQDHLNDMQLEYREDGTVRMDSLVFAELIAFFHKLIKNNH